MLSKLRLILKIVNFLQLFEIWNYFQQTGVRTTYWAPSTVAGACQLPAGNYRVVDALALGQHPALGDLAWRQGLCGQILDVNCGHSTVQAIVADICDLGTGNCGLDLIRRIRNTATNNLPFGVTKCDVTLSKTNPLNADGMQCIGQTQTLEMNISYFYNYIEKFPKSPAPNDISK